MLIGLISDTHLLSGSNLPVSIDNIFDGVDLILHAGDIYEPSVLDKLQQIAPVLAVEGDEDSCGQLDSRVRWELLLTIDNTTIWLTHEMPITCLQLLAYGAEVELLRSITRLCEMTPDIVVFGDTHRALVQRVGSTLFVNPGSPTVPNHLSGPGTVALLTIVSGRTKAQLVQI